MEIICKFCGKTLNNHTGANACTECGNLLCDDCAIKCYECADVYCEDCVSVENVDINICSSCKDLDLLIFNYGDLSDYVDKIKEIRKDLKYKYSVNRELNILDTNLEQIQIFFRAYKNRLIKRGGGDV